MSSKPRKIEIIGCRVYYPKLLSQDEAAELGWDYPIILTTYIRRFERINNLKSGAFYYIRGIELKT